MFNCQSCGKTSKAGEKLTRVVVEERAVTYPPRYKEDEFGKPYCIDNGGEGFEIAEEVDVCPNCAPKEVAA